MFINRDKELAFLEDKWQQNQAQMIVLWGKRRVGKTELVKQFITDKPHLYFLAETTSAQDQLYRLSKMIGDYFDEPLLKTRGFGGWEELFQYIKAKKQKMVFVIDEFPYLIMSVPGIVSLFQKAWDEYWKDSPIYFIILGSSISMMESEVLSRKSPLYGRRTGQWKVQPMRFEHARRFLPKASLTDQMRYYAIIGGVPAYWLKFRTDMNFYENVQQAVLRKGEFLYDEVEFLLREELREPRYYFALLQAIANGKRKLSEIVNATGLTQPTANKYLSVLADLDIVKREIPITETKPLKSKKGLYHIKDAFFRFWFHYVFPKRSLIEISEDASIVQEVLKNFDTYLGSVYEQVAKETLIHHQSTLFTFEAIGRWWEKNHEIDVVAYNNTKNTILFGEAKWSNKAIGINVLEELIEKSGFVKWGNSHTKKYYALFSKSGFTKEILKVSKPNPKLILFTGNKKL